MTDPEVAARRRGEYDTYSTRYDREVAWYERLMLADGRDWACRQARGAVLEVAVGTGRNLGLYPAGVRVVGLDLSGGMLAVARRSCAPRVRVDLVQGDAQAIPFAAEMFDTVLCTLGLSSIPDDRAAVAEMHRVLRPGGRLVLLGHVASPYRAVRAVQHLLERVSAGHQRPADTQTRQVLPLLRRMAFTVDDHAEYRGGVIQRVLATKP